MKIVTVIALFVMGYSVGVGFGVHEVHSELSHYFIMLFTFTTLLLFVIIIDEWELDFLWGMLSNVALNI